MKYLTIIFTFMLVLPQSALAAKKPTTTKNDLTVKTQQQKQSYSLGLNIGTQAQRSFKAQNIDVTNEHFLRGIKDAFTNQTPLISEQEVVTSLRSLQRRIMKAQEERIADKAKAHRAELFKVNNFPYIGSKKADVTIVEFFDYRCPHCQRIAHHLPALVEKDKKLMVIYREFPILGPRSDLAAKAALNAKAQKKYMEYHNALMNSRSITEDSLFTIAKDLKLNTKKFQAALDGKDNNESKLLKETREMAKNIGLSYTPGFFVAPTPIGKAKIDDKAPIYFITGEPSKEDLQKLVEKARKARKS